MAYSVDNIIPINILITPAGIGYANFSTAFIIARQADLEAGATFGVDTYRDYSTLDEVGKDFSVGSDTYQMATRWFANIPKPLTVSVWMWNDDATTGDSIIDTLEKANDAAWRYWYFLPHDVYSVEATAILLADWADATEHPVPMTLSAAAVVDPQSTTDLASVLRNKGNRRVFVGYVPQSIVDTDPTQQYAMVQLAASFQKFRPLGDRTAITAEYQVLPGVIGARDQITTTGYGALKEKNVAFFTAVELKGQFDNSRVINSKSMSSFGEFIDDVVNLDVLKNYLQVDGYNYITGTPTKRGLTPRGYAGLLATLDQTCKQFYNNGVLGQGEYTDPETGETRLAEYGFVNFGRPEDVFDLTTAQKRDRQFPETSILAILARAGHTAAVTVTVE
jgi:hypothetical protein